MTSTMMFNLTDYLHLKLIHLICGLFPAVFLNAAATSPTLKAWVDRLDVHNVWIRWSAQIEPDYCEYLYQPLEASQASVLSINELHRRLIHIGDLKAGYIYIFYIVCTASQDVHQSKHITFRTVMPAPRTPHPVLPEKSPKKIGPKLEMYPDTIDDSMSVTDIVLGAVFAVFGLAVISITGWYLWRKVQHRQRVANFVRHQDSADNFDAIHPPVDVAQS